MGRPRSTRGLSRQDREKSYIKILSTRWVTCSSIHILGATVQHLVACASWLPGYVHPGLVSTIKPYSPFGQFSMYSTSDDTYLFDGKDHCTKSVGFDLVGLTIVVLVFDWKMAVRCTSLSHTEFHKLVCATVMCGGCCYKYPC